MEDEKKKLIRERCIAANQEILTRADLIGQIETAILAQKYGIQGKLELTGPLSGIMERKLALDELEGQETLLRWLKKGYFPATQVLGFPIRLADVLYAIWLKTKINGALSVHPDGSIEHQFEYSEFKTSCGWNLRDDDLEKQSKETIEFLYDLLKS